MSKIASNFLQRKYCDSFFNKLRVEVAKTLISKDDGEIDFETFIFIIKESTMIETEVKNIFKWLPKQAQNNICKFVGVDNKTLLKNMSDAIARAKADRQNINKALTKEN